LTIAVGALSASFQNDIKKLVAYSTISQMGYLFCGCGFLCYTEVLLYLIIHALNKAFLFILVGYIVHFYAGNTDMRLMGSTYPLALDFTFLLLVLNLNLSGLPLSAGFLAKEFLIFQTIRDEFFLNFLKFF
jgi:NADH-quinone oxidoreductase subunit L